MRDHREMRIWDREGRKEGQGKREGEITERDMERGKERLPRDEGKGLGRRDHREMKVRD